ncbi:chemotaxis protein CheW [Leptolyngbya sp. 7M]|uniref:chemotaxis protein CheW n=1 Tax=Leptolyngbya sp. 7M TaxID=2812896 RepID=UPI001B8B9B04|nr:chemotaxis protein CheW [Leptolyngbya sp. 7M]QYO62213.1 chemotaxis protein CheW [Leptolyngbya sp. 7M]
MEIIEDFPLPASSGLNNRYFLTYVGEQRLAVPTKWVAEIILVERSQILSLPFYDSLLLGLIYHQGVIVPLITAHLLLSRQLNSDIPLRVLKEKLSVIRLSQSAEHLSGVGIVVDRVVAQIDDHSIAAVPSQTSIFQLTDVPTQVWQPL